MWLHELEKWLPTATTTPMTTMTATSYPPADATSFLPSNENHSSSRVSSNSEDSIMPLDLGPVEVRGIFGQSDAWFDPKDRCGEVFVEDEAGRGEQLKSGNVYDKSDSNDDEKVPLSSAKAAEVGNGGVAKSRKWLRRRRRSSVTVASYAMLQRLPEMASDPK
jgi:hypothetical protein